MRTNMTLSLQRLVYSSITPTNSHVILHDNPQRESHKPHDPPTSVTWLNLLSKQTKNGTSTALMMQKHTDQCAHDLTHSPDMWHQSRFTNVTRNWSWRLYGINHTIRHIQCQISKKQWSISGHTITPTDTTPPIHAYLFALSSGLSKINAGVRKEIEADISRQIHC